MPSITEGRVTYAAGLGLDREEAVANAKQFKAMGKSNSWIAAWLCVDESSVRSFLLESSRSPLVRQWKQVDSGRIVQTAGDKHDVDVSIFSQTVEAWNGSLTPAMNEIITKSYVPKAWTPQGDILIMSGKPLVMPEPTTWSRFKNWLGLV